jgi:hypothetical protein
MKSIGITQRSIWAGLALLLLLASLLLLLSPEERELGSGIKSIYVHVALTWTGMSGLIIAGLVGLASAVLNRENLQSWAISITWVALGFFALGLVMSVIAAGINWGAVFWQEPRTSTVLQVLALGLIVQGINTWPVPFRLKGILSFMLAVILMVLIFTTPLVLHPGNAATTANSLAIRFTFFGLYAVAMAAAALIVFALQRR